MKAYLSLYQVGMPVKCILCASWSGHWWRMWYTSTLYSWETTSNYLRTDLAYHHLVRSAKWYHDQATSTSNGFMGKLIAFYSCSITENVCKCRIYLQGNSQINWCSWPYRGGAKSLLLWYGQGNTVWNDIQCELLLLFI